MKSNKEDTGYLAVVIGGINTELESLQKKYEKLVRQRKNAWIGYTILGVTGFTGGALTTHGIFETNSATLISGISVTAAGVLITTVGHYLFNFW